MTNILVGIVVILMAISGFLYNQNKGLVALNQAYEVRDAQQKEAIESLQNDFELQTNGLLQMQSRNQEIEAEMSRYLDIFRRHDLSKLASARPGLIEPRINNGTKEVFESIEEDSRNIDSLDSGIQLQPNTE
tara:strand:- start:1299 stop:1694 length:396 start_codon:yes stop_codon:yes gene_type:complete